MKKSLLLSLALSFSLISFAQTQQGYVKTKGRMVDGQLVPGQGLKGATVSIHGRTTVLVNADDGAFSFPVPEAQFRLDSVRKKGYQLVDMDALSKIYKHSANPIYLVMETPEQQLQDQLAAERKIRRTLTNQLHQREDEIESLKAQQKLSDEEYRQALQRLYEDVDQNEQLVKDMVERYSKIDYDQLSEFDKQISEYILNGELTKADSLLSTKGNLDERVKQYKKHEAINAREREELSQRKKQLDQSELLAQKELEDITNDCYRKFEIFKMQHLNDSAAYYIELRAGVDTINSNTEWLCDAGSFLETYLAQYDRAMKYYKKALALTHPMDSSAYASICNEIGSLFKTVGEYDEALVYYQIAMNYLDKSKDKHPMELANLFHSLANLYNNLTENEKALQYYWIAIELYESRGSECLELAEVYNSMGTLYCHIDKFDTAIVYQKKALDICKVLCGDNHSVTASIYNNLGATYFYQGDYQKAMEYYEASMEITETIYGEGHPDIALMYNNMGEAMAMQGKFKESINYLQKSIEIYSRVYGEYNWHVAAVYRNLGAKHISMSDYDQASNSYMKALDIATKSKRQDIVAGCYNGLGRVQNELGNYAVSIDYYEKALALDTILFGPNSLEAANVYNNIAGDYYDTGDYETGLIFAKKALQIRIEALGDKHPDVIQSYNSIGYAYFQLEDFSQCIEYFNRALDICKTKNNVNHETVAATLFNIGFVYLTSGDFLSAIKYINEAIEVYASAFGKQNVTTASRYHDLGDAYYGLGDFNKALECYEKSLEIKIPILGEDHKRVKATQQKISEIQAKTKEQENQQNE